MKKEKLIQTLKEKFMIIHSCDTYISIYIAIESEKNFNLFRKLFDILECTWYDNNKNPINPVDNNNITDEIICHLDKKDYYPYYLIEISKNNIEVFYGTQPSNDKKLIAAKENIKKLKKLFNKKNQNQIKIIKLKTL
jgi:hypothetical protein